MDKEDKRETMSESDVDGIDYDWMPDQLSVKDVAEILGKGMGTCRRC